MKTLHCDSCHQPMKLVKKGRTTRTKNKSRIRRFHCDLCDITQTIYADGERDLIHEPMEAARKAGNVKTADAWNQLEESLVKNINW